MPDAHPADMLMLPGAAIVGGGPAGLAAAEVLLAAGVPVDLYDAMPSLGRKFLLAGKGGLNLTHAEPFEPFVGRYRERSALLAPLLRGFGPDALRDWARGLGVETFVGTSQRVFPVDFKAAPLLRAWLHRLRGQGLRVHVRHRWLGFGDHGALRLDSPLGPRAVRPAVTVLAMGGASWPQLGSDGAWQGPLREAGADVAPLQPANCGFDIGWSEHLRQRHAGAPLKGVALAWTGPDGRPHRQLGEALITDTGLEGSLVYAASADLRQAIALQGAVTVHLDLLPARDAPWVERELGHPRGPRSLSTHLKTRLRLDGAKAALLHEVLRRPGAVETGEPGPARLAALIKALPLTLTAARPIAEAISSAGGLRFEALDASLMLRARPGVFCAGEMLDWEAPTGGYLLTACFATGRRAGQGAVDWLATPHRVAAAAG